MIEGSMVATGGGSTGVLIGGGAVEAVGNVVAVVGVIDVIAGVFGTSGEGLGAGAIGTGMVGEGVALGRVVVVAIGAVVAMCCIGAREFKYMWPIAPSGCPSVASLEGMGGGRRAAAA